MNDMMRSHLNAPTALALGASATVSLCEELREYRILQIKSPLTGSSILYSLMEASTVGRVSQDY